MAPSLRAQVAATRPPKLRQLYCVLVVRLFVHGPKGGCTPGGLDPVHRVPMGESLLVHILNLGVPGCRIAKAVYPRMNSGRLQDLNK